MSDSEKIIEIFPDNDPRTNPRWYALYTKPRAEKKVLVRLEEKNITTYLPMVKEKREWSDRSKIVEVPLLKSYIFINIPLIDSLKALKTQGVIGFVKFNDEYAPIPDYQINTLKKSLEIKSNLEPVEYYKQGQLVKVVRGPLEGAIGRVKVIKNQSKLVISLDALQSSYGINVNLRDVEPVKKKQENK
jgi:transcription antitermination factor NusG